MYRIIALLLFAIFFFQCENAKVKVDEETTETTEVPKAMTKDLAVKKDEKTFKLERKKPENKPTASRTVKQPNMTGHFVYAADAALFFPCGTTEKYPVAGDAYLAMERAYTSLADLKFAEKVYVKIIGEFGTENDMSGEKVKHVMVNEFLGFERGKNCE